MSTITHPPRPPIPARPREMTGQRPLPRGIVGLVKNQQSQPSAALEKAAEGTLIVGRDIQVKGRLEDCQVLVVEGRVEAAVKAQRLEVRKGGTFVGAAEVDQADVSGHFDGTLTAAKNLNIASSGRVRGEICYARIAIEAGGEISGNVGTAAEAAKEQETSKRPSLTGTGA